MKNSLRVFLVEQDEEGKFKDPAPENNLMFKNVSSKARKSLDSLDNQIDALILGYEKASIRSKDESERINESLNSLSLTALLMEQEEGEEEADTEEGAEEGGEEGGGGAKVLRQQIQGDTVRRCLRRFRSINVIDRSA